MIFFRIIKYQFISLMKPSYIFITISIFVLQFLMGFENIYKFFIESRLKEMVFMLYFPLQLPVDLFRILFFLTPILFIVGLFIHNETENSKIYSLLHMKSYDTWFHAILTSLLIFITVFFSCAYLVMGGLTYIFSSKAENQINDILLFFSNTDASILLIHQFLLLILSVYCMVLFHIFILFLCHHSALSTLITIGVLSLSVVVGFLFPKFLPFLPFTYGLLGFHEMNDYSFLWAYIGSICTVLFLYIFVFLLFHIRKEEIFIYEKI